MKDLLNQENNNNNDQNQQQPQQQQINQQPPQQHLDPTMSNPQNGVNMNQNNQIPPMNTIPSMDNNTNIPPPHNPNLQPTQPTSTPGYDIQSISATASAATPTYNQYGGFNSYGQPSSYGSTNVYGQPGGNFNYGAANSSFTAGSLGAIPQTTLYNSVKMENNDNSTQGQSLVDMHSGVNTINNQLPGIQSTRK